MADDTRMDAVAHAIAVAQDADYWVAEIADWEALEQWQRDAQPQERPGIAYEDRDYFRAAAVAALAAADRVASMTCRQCGHAEGACACDCDPEETTHG